MTIYYKDIGENYRLGDLYKTKNWVRCSLYHIIQNDIGGITSWPIAEIDVFNGPPRENTHPHKEVVISLRNDLRRVKAGFEVKKIYQNSGTSTILLIA